MVRASRRPVRVWSSQAGPCGPLPAGQRWPCGGVLSGLGRSSLPLGAGTGRSRRRCLLAGVGGRASNRGPERSGRRVGNREGDAARPLQETVREPAAASFADAALLARNVAGAPEAGKGRTQTNLRSLQREPAPDTEPGARAEFKPPGRSHDTMTYCLDRKSPISPNESRLLQLLAKVVPCITQPVVLKWSVTQGLQRPSLGRHSTRHRLAVAVPLKLPAPAFARTCTCTRTRTRTCFSPEPGQVGLLSPEQLCPTRAALCFIATCSGPDPGSGEWLRSPFDRRGGPRPPKLLSPVQDTLTEISEWLENHPREVVILACRNFDGMTADLHEYLVTCIKNIFGDMLCPRGEVPTLRQLWARGQQVVLSYDDECAVRRHRQLWPAIPYWWGNQVKPEKLVRYLEQMQRCGRPDGLFVAGINLTENLQYILAHPAASLRKVTVPSLPYLSTWVREQSPGPGPRCINIIAGDFIGADTFVSDVIRLNEKLLSC
ncbi:PI-PLC X domain-containing protein 1 [Pteropus vampyrus]|uniref:PI-PLC X domain-containing protein 1 n=1 Tax=Pteropus vampyrus TaxID=132908 RepID=A0A6P6C3S1_PTEVA|nr:PI-PLC X domain-containing protein 1 [Pteropus vampyrus]